MSTSQPRPFSIIRGIPASHVGRWSSLLVLCLCAAGCGLGSVCLVCKKRDGLDKEFSADGAVPVSDPAFMSCKRVASGAE